MKTIAFALAAALLAAAPAGGRAEEPRYLIDARNTDLRAFIEDVARLTGMTFIVDSGVEGVVVATGPSNMTRAELLDLFAAALRANGAAMKPSVAGAYRIVRLPSDAGASRL